MLKKILILIAIIISSKAPECFAKNNNFNKTPNREIILLLDDKSNIMESVEKTLAKAPKYQSPTDNPSGMGAMTITSIIALHQQAAPIVISRTLIENILNHKQIFEDFATKNTKYLKKRYSRHNRFKNLNNLKEFKKNCKYAYNKSKQLDKCLKKLINNTDPKKIESIFAKITKNKNFSVQQAPKKLDYTSGKTSKNYPIYTEIMLYFLCHNSITDLNSWVIKKVSTDLYLFIPKDYIKNIDQLALRQLKAFCAKKSACTAIENNLGLRVNHLKNISSISEYLKKHKSSDKQKNITHYLEKIFTQTKEFKENNIWSVYIAGHGFPEVQLETLYQQLKKLEKLYTKKSKNYRDIQNAKKIKSEISYVQNKIAKITDNQRGIIVSLPKQEFQDLLIFFNNKINTALIYYTSCFSGGELLVKPYQKDNKDLILNYHVISGTLAENIAMQEMPTITLPPYNNKTNKSIPINQKLEFDDIDIQNKTLKLKTTLQYKDFFESLRNGLHLDSKNLPVVTFKLHPYTDKPCGTLRQECMGNIPSVRLAGDNKFTIIPNDNSFLVIDQDYLQKHNSTIDLSLNKATLLYTDYIKPEIFYNKKACKQIPACISMTPGFAIHTFNSISAPKFNLSEIMGSFLCFPELCASKIFFIKKLKCSKSKKLSKYANNTNNTVELEDVIIMRNILSSDSLDNKQPGRPPLDTCIYFTDPTGKSSMKLVWNGPVITEKNYKFNRCHLDEHKQEMLAYQPKLKEHLTNTITV